MSDDTTNDQAPKIIRVDTSDVMWIDEHRDFLEENYPGKWIAVKGQELVAVGDSLRDVLEESKRKGVTDPLVGGVRRADLRGAIFVL
jgi:hypothetical protein